MTETRTLQVWPGGASYTIQGDPDGPVNQRRLKRGYDRTARWRRGTAAEWRSIRIELRAELYGEQDILGCDSSLVDDLRKIADTGRDDIHKAFSVDEIRGLYADPSDWDEDECKEYASDNGLDLPEPDEHDQWIADAREVCREYAQYNPAEVYEWWRVSSWLCAQLASVGEVTIDNGYGHWWGRTCTGQGWIMDGTLQKVAALFEDDRAGLKRSA